MELPLFPGIYVVGGAIVIFYLRMMQLRGKRKREAHEAELERIKKRKKNKKGGALPTPTDQLTIQVKSWWLVGVGAVVMLLGLLMYTSPNGFFGIPALWMAYWWIVTSVGVLVFTTSLK